MKNIMIFSILFLILSCSEAPDNDVINSNFSYGEYDAISITSNIAIDANFDGIYSTDFRIEFLSESIRNHSSFKFNPDENNSSSLIIVLPTMHRAKPEFETDQTSILNRITFVKISDINGEITSTQPILTVYGEPTETRVTNINIIDNETIELTFFHNLIYDIVSESWQNIIVEGVYKRRKN